jgi:hypothetical protein
MDAECGIIADASEEDGVLALTGGQDASSERRSSDRSEAARERGSEERVEQYQVVDGRDFAQMAMEIPQM